MAVPVLTPEHVREIDAAAGVEVAVLVERAGAALAHAAIAMLGGTYGRRVAVIAGPGSNGADGKVAARRLAARGVRCEVIDAAAAADRVIVADLVIDAAYGTGFHGEWRPPDVGDTPVLACDVPSGVDGLTGRVGGAVLRAEQTVTFVGMKAGLLSEPGRSLAGRVIVAPIGLDAWSSPSFAARPAHLVDDGDVRAWLPRRDPAGHKWRSAVTVVAGSPGMTGAAHLAAAGAMRAGAGMVRLGTPGASPSPGLALEAVGVDLDDDRWADVVLRELDRSHALVIGPGLGRDEAVAAEVRRLVALAPVPVVVDGDALWALAWSAEGAAAVVRDREHPTVLTPHDGEFTLVRGARVGSDRMFAARELAATCRAVVVLKGPTTMVAAPDGEVLVVADGDERLATAGTGDVLAGICGAMCAQGVEPLRAAALAASVHARAARFGPRRGLVASDLPALVPRVLDHLLDHPEDP